MTSATNRPVESTKAFRTIGYARSSGLVGICLLALAARMVKASGENMPTLMDEPTEMALALSSCPPAVAKAAGVYLLTRSGYEKARDSQNGFTAIVQHSAPTATEPQCMDAEGSRTILQRYLKVAVWRAQGKTPLEIRQLTKEAFEKGELQAPSRPGVDYMLSNSNTVPNEKGEHVPYVPHVMFFGTHLSNADLGVGKELGADGQPIGPAYVAGEGSPYALVIVPVGTHGEHSHSAAGDQ